VASIDMGVDLKQLETHRWTWCQLTSIFLYSPFVGVMRSTPYSKVGRRREIANLCKRWGDSPDPGRESLLTVANAPWPRPRP